VPINSRVEFKIIREIRNGANQLQCSPFGCPVVNSRNLKGILKMPTRLKVLCIGNGRC
jgi:hypothetical protein